MPVSAPLRLARAALFAALCVTMSALGHELMGGATIPAWAIAVAFGAVFALAAAVAGRRRSAAGVVLAMVVGQLALHYLFAAAGDWFTGPPPADLGHGPLSLLLCGPRDGHGMVILPPGTDAARLLANAGLTHGTMTHAMSGGVMSGGAMPGMDMGGGAAGHIAPMLLGHALAGAVTGWWLCSGEALLWRALAVTSHRAAFAVTGPAGVALRLLRWLVGAATSGRPARRLTASPAATEPARPRPSFLLRDAVVRRGPPPLAAC